MHNHFMEEFPMTSMKTLLLGAVMTGALFAPAMVRAEEHATTTTTTEKTTTTEQPTAATVKKDGEYAERGAKAFAESDKDNSNSISEEEFLARHKDKFKEIDTNKDGSISREEFAAHGETMKSKFKERREHMKEKAGEAMERKADEKPAE
jgi:hypothetical protein